MNIEQKIEYLNSMPSSIQLLFRAVNYYPNSGYDADAFLKSAVNFDSDQPFVVEVHPNGEKATALVEVNKDNFYYHLDFDSYNSFSIEEKFRVTKWIFKDICKTLNIKKLGLTFMPTSANALKENMGFYNPKQNILFINPILVLQGANRTMLVIRHELEHYRQINTEIKEKKELPNLYDISKAVVHTSRVTRLLLNGNLVEEYLKYNPEYLERYNNIFFKPEWKQFVQNLYYTNQLEFSANKKAYKNFKKFSKINPFPVFETDKGEMQSDNFFETDEELRVYRSQFVSDFRQEYANSLFQIKMISLELTYLDIKRCKNSITLNEINPETENGYLKAKRNELLTENYYLDYKIKIGIEALLDIFETKEMADLPDDFFREITSFESLEDLQVL